MNIATIVLVELDVMQEDHILDIGGVFTQNGKKGRGGTGILIALNDQKLKEFLHRVRIHSR